MPEGLYACRRLRPGRPGLAMYPRQAKASSAGNGPLGAILTGEDMVMTDHGDTMVSEALLPKAGGP